MGQIVEGRKVTLADLKKMAEAARNDVWKAANTVGRTPKIYLHWTAGHYGQFWDDYHINIDKDGGIYVTTDDLSEVLEHTYHRNTGAIGVAMACCPPPANTQNLGDEPPTIEQINSMAQVIMTLCDALWLSINQECVLTHGEAADNIDGIYASDPYGPQAVDDNGDSIMERWDLQFLGTEESPIYTIDYDDAHTGGNVLRGKAIWYQNKEDES